MLWRVAICCWFWMLPGAALAQAVAVDSGEHGAFTRLTLPLAEGDWSFTRRGTGYDLSMPQADGFDLSRAFEKITRDRIAAITAIDGSRLRIELACDCMASAFVWRSNFLVIDVREDAEPARAVLAPVVRAPDVLPGWFPTEIALPLPFAAPSAPEPVEAGATDAAEVIPPAVGFEVQAEIAPEIPSENTSLPSGFEAAIAQDLARAASQGLLSLVETKAPAPIPVGLEEISPPSPEPTPSVRPGVKVETSIDRAFPPEIEQKDPLIDWRVCLDQSVFYLPEQHEGQTVSTSISSIRAALYPDPQKIDLEAASDFVRTLISYGFGAEARQAIGLAELSDEEAAVLRAMAYIVDGETPGAGLADQAGCSDLGGFWAYISGLADAPKSLASVIASYRGLPASLRERLGYLLAARLAADGAQNEADAIFKLASGGEPREPALASIAAAQLDHHAGKPAAALRELESALATGARPTPELLLDLVASAAAEGKAVSDAQLFLIEEAIFARRGTPEALPLDAALIRARIGRGELLAAQRQLTERRSDFDAALYQELAGRLATAALTAADDVFLRITFDDDALPDGIALRNAMSERLGGLGFMTRANEILQIPTQEATLSNPDPAMPDPAMPVETAPAVEAQGDPVFQARRTLENASAAVDLAKGFLTGSH